MYLVLFFSNRCLLCFVVIFSTELSHRSIVVFVFVLWSNKLFVSGLLRTTSAKLFKKKNSPLWNLPSLNKTIFTLATRFLFLHVFKNYFHLFWQPSLLLKTDLPGLLSGFETRELSFFRGNSLDFNSLFSGLIINKRTKHTLDWSLSDIYNNTYWDL